VTSKNTNETRREMCVFFASSSSLVWPFKNFCEEEKTNNEKCS
jgi:hypothetical protein